MAKRTAHTLTPYSHYCFIKLLTRALCTIASHIVRPSSSEVQQHSASGIHLQHKFHCYCHIAAAGAAIGPAATRGLEESFVVLPGAASVLRPSTNAAASSSRDPTAVPGTAGSSLQQQQQSAVAAGPTGPPAGSSAAAAMAAVAAAATAERSSASAGLGSSSTRAVVGGLDAKLETLASLCELASTVTGVDHPLCLDCAAQLKEEVEAQIAELESEIAAYSNALAKLEAEAPVALPQVSFELYQQGLQQYCLDEICCR